MLWERGRLTETEAKTRRGRGKGSSGRRAAESNARACQDAETSIGQRTLGEQARSTAIQNAHRERAAARNALPTNR